MFSVIFSLTIILKTELNILYRLGSISENTGTFKVNHWCHAFPPDKGILSIPLWNTFFKSIPEGINAATAVMSDFHGLLISQ